MSKRYRMVILGLSITSSWGNGHATTYRALARSLAEAGHEVLFLERDVPWYAQHRDLASPPYCRTCLYSSLEELADRFSGEVRDADLVVVGSYVPDGVPVGDWVQRTACGVTAFYDIDTPVTMAKLRRHDHEYLEPRQISGYDLYLSFTGGPLLRWIETEYGASRALPLHCSFDETMYGPEEQEAVWDLGYLGTYSDDRQPPLDELMVRPAREWSAGRFVVAGPQYPAVIQWPVNVERVEHLPPGQHRAFYNRQRFTLNITRADMIRAGYSPSVRLFEAAACGVPIISDHWEGLETFFRPGQEILVSHHAGDTLRFLREMDEGARRAVGERARARVMAEHTSRHRAAQLAGYLGEAWDSRGAGRSWTGKDRPLVAASEHHGGKP